MPESDLATLTAADKNAAGTKPETPEKKTAAQRAAEATNRRTAEAHAARLKNDPSRQSPTAPANVELVSVDVVEGARHDGLDSISADATLHPETARATEASALAEDIERIRKLRIGWSSGLMQKLALPVRRGYKRHWFNDSGNRIEDAKASGWSTIKGSDGQPIKRIVGSARSGQPLAAYAMEIPEVFWLEDLAAKNKVAEDQLDTVRGKPFQVPPGMAKRSDAGKFYSPNESVVGIESRVGAPTT